MWGRLDLLPQALGLGSRVKESAELRLEIGRRRGCSSFSATDNMLGGMQAISHLLLGPLTIFARLDQARRWLQPFSLL